MQCYTADLETTVEPIRSFFEYTKGINPWQKTSYQNMCT